MNTTTQSGKRYKVALITGTAKDQRNIEFLMADSPEQLNSMINSRVRLFRADAHWKACVVRGTGRSPMNSEMLKVVNTQPRCSVTWAEYDPNGILVAKANAFVSDKGLFWNNSGQWKTA
jgi:hypothetical protein